MKLNSDYIEQMDHWRLLDEYQAALAWLVKNNSPSADADESVRHWKYWALLSGELLGRLCLLDDRHDDIFLPDNLNDIQDRLEREERNNGAMKLGANIAKARKAAGLTQTALAKKLYVNPTCISKWENGWIIPAPDTIIRLAEVLKTDPNTLLGWEDE